MDWGGDAMDHDTSILTRLKEEARLRHQNATDSWGDEPEDQHDRQ
jgi:hypothetical protein